MVDALGVFLGWGYLLRHILEWRRFTAFAAQRGIAGPRSFIYLYFQQFGRDMAWSLMMYEFADTLGDYIFLDNLDILREAAAADRGVVLVGAHYGPGVCVLTLARHNIQATAIASPLYMEDVNIISNLGVNFLTDNKYKFLGVAGRLLPAGKGEKALVKKLKAGGVVVILPDRPRVDDGGVACEFLGRKARFNYFPFKLAQKYQAPVLFYYFAPNHKGGYCLHFVPFGKYEDPAAGVERYLDILKILLTIDPYAWGGLPFFLKTATIS